MVLFQADVCHAYQVVHQNGVPDEQIVVMMYDDIANNKEWVSVSQMFAARVKTLKTQSQDCIFFSETNDEPLHCC